MGIPFADRLEQAIESSQSVLVAGIDPRIDDLPEFILARARATKTSFADRVEYALSAYSDRVIGLIAGKVAATKPNLAFFEQYGIGGLKAFDYFMQRARQARLLTIADAKRGDIGSTAQAYSAAFLGRVRAFGESHPAFDADALTVNPFLGFDTVREFMKDCVEYGKGLFILVKTSNPGAADLQSFCKPSAGHSSPTVSDAIADFIAEHQETLAGSPGPDGSRLSGLGAVVGATYPHEAEALRLRMPHALFLIPGFGAQGGTAKDAMAGFTRSSPRRGGIVNASRGIFSIPNAATTSPEEFDREILERIAKSNAQLNQARAAPL